MKPLLLCIAILLGSAAFAGDPIPDTKLVLVFRHVIGNEELVLGNNYVNALGDTINVRKFKYYLSNFSITDQSGTTTVLPQQYFLVDEFQDTNFAQLYVWSSWQKNREISAWSATTISPSTAGAAPWSKPWIDSSRFFRELC